MHPIIRPMRAGDVDAVLALQAIAYADAAFAPEGAAVYLNRMKLAPDLCLVAQTAAGDLIGYLVSHPWHDGKPPALGTVLAALPVPATRWYLHDCAVAASARGSGVAAALYESAHDVAVCRGLRCAALVAVGDAAGYWAQRGYRAAAGALPAHALASYGELWRRGLLHDPRAWLRRSTDKLLGFLWEGSSGPRLRPVSKLADRSGRGAAKAAPTRPAPDARPVFGLRGFAGAVFRPRQGALRAPAAAPVFLAASA